MEVKVMFSIKKSDDELRKYINKAIKEIKSRNYESAKEALWHAVEIDDCAPEIHNTFGILYECKRELDLAHKHYSAAYAIDSAFIPARKNLERISDFAYKYDLSYIDYGLEYDECISDDLCIAYDKNKVEKLMRIN